MCDTSEWQRTIEYFVNRCTLGNGPQITLSIFVLVRLSAVVREDPPGSAECGLVVVVFLTEPPVLGGFGQVDIPLDSEFVDSRPPTGMSGAMVCGFCLCRSQCLWFFPC